MPKAKTEGAGFLSKSEKAKLQRLYRDGKAAYGSIKILQKASGLSKKKLPTFYTVKIPTQSIVMQRNISKDCQHLLSKLMRSGVSI